MRPPPAQDGKGGISGAVPPKQSSLVCALLPPFLIEYFSADTACPILRLPADPAPFQVRSSSGPEARQPKLARSQMDCESPRSCNDGYAQAATSTKSGWFGPGKGHDRPVAAFHRWHPALRCGPSLLPFIPHAAFYR
jgi:hypothetical protein